MLKSTISKFEENRQQAVKESVSLSLKKIFVDGVLSSLIKTEQKKEHFNLAIERVEEIFKETIECDRERYLKKIMEQYALLKSQFIEKDRQSTKAETDLRTLLHKKESEIEKLVAENHGLRLRIDDLRATAENEARQLKDELNKSQKQLNLSIKKQIRTDDVNKIRKKGSAKLLDFKEEFMKNSEETEITSETPKKGKVDYRDKYRKYKNVTKSLRDKILLFEEAVKEFENLNSLQKTKIKQLEDNVYILIQRETSMLLKIHNFECDVKSSGIEIERLAVEKQKLEAELEKKKEEKEKSKEASTDPPNYFSGNIPNFEII